MSSVMYSDNGTTFVGADKELNQAYRAAITDLNLLNKIAITKVEWKYILPHAPHFGGLWEAGVRSVKYHLHRLIGAHTLTFEEFTTLLCRVKACLNSRHLGPIRDTVDDYETLIPGHFLIGSALNAIPEPSVLSISESRLSRWQLIRQLTERFWRIWQTDYVNTLQQKGKWRKQQPSIDIGAMVLLKNDFLPPCKWELDRVI
ncbi:uncharacterized protein LOC118645772 [Monomorium pharaonis]|uniref:uncharacterized protein LOC118645772 n=1 Tax=Monomorium pharaonis TaxID=307658 RepID=UPI0017474695|nr:uncharacterized protein LOC118645772 [Monomorium pharaonis]